MWAKKLVTVVGALAGLGFLVGAQPAQEARADCYASENGWDENGCYCRIGKDNGKCDTFKTPDEHGGLLACDGPNGPCNEELVC
jgi:hypothetical protein